MIAGLLLAEEKGMDCHLAFLGDELEILSVETNPEIVEEISGRQPEVLAVNTDVLTGQKELMGEEEELKDEGHAFTPVSHEKMKSRRLEALKEALKVEMGQDLPEIVRFDPQITSKQLAIDGDTAMESLGVDTSNIRSAQQFDAALGAVTARFYQQNQFSDLGVIVPEPLDEED